MAPAPLPRGRGATGGRTGGMAAPARPPGNPRRRLPMPFTVPPPGPPQTPAPGGSRGRATADRQMGVGAGDKGGVDGEEGEVGGLPVGPAAEPEGVDRGEPPEAESRRWGCADRLNGHPSSPSSPRGGFVPPPTT